MGVARKEQGVGRAPLTVRRRRVRLFYVAVVWVFFECWTGWQAQEEGGPRAIEQSFPRQRTRSRHLERARYLCRSGKHRKPMLKTPGWQRPAEEDVAATRLRRRRSEDDCHPLSRPVEEVQGGAQAFEEGGCFAWRGGLRR